MANHFRSKFAALRCTALLLGSLLLVTSARAEPGSALRLSSPAETAESSAAVDYNARDPHAGLLSHLRAFANVQLVNYVIWQISWSRGSDWPPVTRDSLGVNLRDGLILDQDELQTNFFGHPYHGALHFNAARATGLGFWESALHTALGSATWEFFGERERPSLNDLATTTLGGILLGEVTYRLSSELLDEGFSGFPRFASELGGAVLNPVRGFNRLYTGQAWRSGPRPVRHRTEVSWQMGFDRVRVSGIGDDSSYGPAALVALDVLYGDLLPRFHETRFAPFEYFDFYIAANLLDGRLEGAQVYANALLFGASQALSRDLGASRDNQVLGVSMTYEYQGANFANYGGAGIGPAGYWTLRFDAKKSLLLAGGLDMVPIVGVTRGEHADSNVRGYSFGTGGAAWASARLELGPFGKLRLRARHYLSRLIDGDHGGDYTGATRASYEVDVLPGVGLGTALTLIQRERLWSVTSASSTQLDTQLYVRVHNQ